MNKLLPVLCAALLAACSGSGGSTTSSSTSTGTSGGQAAGTSGNGGNGAGSGTQSGGASSGSAGTTASTTSSGASTSAGSTTSTSGGNGSSTSTSGGNGTTTTSGGAGAGTFADPGFSDMHFAPDPDGSMHLAFEDGVAEYVNYGHCSSNCGDPSNWGAVRLLDMGQLGATAIWPAGIGRDSAGTLHLLVGGVPAPGGSGGVRLLYGACTGACSSPSSWSAVDLTGLFPDDYLASTGETFAVEPSGRLSFVSNGGYYQPYYATCASNCLQASSWQVGAVFDGSTIVRGFRVDAQGVSHALLSVDTGVSGERVLAYARCASGCTQASNWVKSAQGFLQSTNGISSYATAFAVTASGRLWMFFQPGGLSPAGSSDHVLQGWTCLGSGCTDLSQWAGVSFASSDEGDNGIGAAALGEAVVLASTGHFDLNVFACDGSCESPGNWRGPQAVDSPNAISAALSPDNDGSCPGSATFAAWYPKAPSVGISSSGVVVMHEPYALVTCPGESGPSTGPTIGRAISTF